MTPLLKLAADTGSPGAQHSIAMALLPIISGGSFNDVSVICSDGRFSTARAILAVTFPDFHLVLASASDDPVTMVLPDFTVREVKKVVWDRVTHGLHHVVDPHLHHVLDPDLGDLGLDLGDPHPATAESDTEVLQEDEEYEEEGEEEFEEQDDDYLPLDEMSEYSDTEILGDDDEMMAELKNLATADTTSCLVVVVVLVALVVVVVVVLVAGLVHASSSCAIRNKSK